MPRLSNFICNPSLEQNNHGCVTPRVRCTTLIMLGRDGEVATRPRPHNVSSSSTSIRHLLQQGRRLAVIALESQPHSSGLDTMRSVSPFCENDSCGKQPSLHHNPELTTNALQNKAIVYCATRGKSSSAARLHLRACKTSDL